LPVVSAASFECVRPFPKAMLVRRLGALAASRRHELCRVAAATIDC
jgi:mRNA-degrading endonuclease toxin of MazEF toxin-antitoxin module